MANNERIESIALSLYKAYKSGSIFKQNTMPESILPSGVSRGSKEHIMFLTLTVSIDYMRDADKLWESSRKTYEDPSTRYLFDTESLAKTNKEKIAEDMKKYGLAKRPNKDAGIWKRIGTTLYIKYEGDPRKFLESNEYDSCKIIKSLNDDKYIENEREVNGFPNLRGKKIAPLWIRMLSDEARINLKNLDKIEIPVDIHVARASLSLGVVRGKYNENQREELFNKIRSAWSEGLGNTYYDNKRIFPLDVDVPLWLLSRGGCSISRDKETGSCDYKENKQQDLEKKCPVVQFCILGKIKNLSENMEVDT